MQTAQCQDTTALACEVDEGDFMGEGTVCGPTLFCSPEAFSPCCLSDGSCEFRTEANCVASNGEWHPEVWECTEQLCATRGCCVGLECLSMTSAECASDGGQAILTCEGATCESVEPENSGACCLVDGTCEFYEPFVCLAFNGSYQGDKVKCEDIDCSAGD